MTAAAERHREFETARRFVRFANSTLQRAAQTPPRVPPPVAAQIAVGDAARIHVPGLVPFLASLLAAPSSTGEHQGEPSSGTWVRQGTSIVIDLG